ncbi:MAG: alpha/beta hydrolase [Patescibacteria group bacterium]
MKKQVVVIHGGDSFDTHEEYISFLKNFEIDSLDYFRGKSWKTTLQERLGDDFEVILPRMPNPFDARYAEWKIWFDKLVPFLNDGVMLVGHSLGGIFLAKYLSENKFPKTITATILVSAPFDGEGDEESLVDFVLPSSIELFEKQGGKIIIYQSKDDTSVLPIQCEKYKKALPSAYVMMFEDRGHFTQEEFPELVEKIKEIS